MDRPPHGDASLTIMIPHLVPVALGICLLCVAMAGLMRIPLWLRRHTAVKKASPVAWLGTWVATGVFCFGVGAVGYRLYSSGYYAPKFSAMAISAKPTLVLLWENDQLRLDNRGGTDIFLCGSKIGDAPADIMTARPIPGNTHYYLNPAALKYEAQRIFDENGLNLVPFEIYLTNSDHKKYTARFALLLNMQDGAMSIRIRPLGVADGW